MDIRVLAAPRTIQTVSCLGSTGELDCIIGARVFLMTQKIAGYL